MTRCTIFSTCKIFYTQVAEDKFLVGMLPKLLLATIFLKVALSTLPFKSNKITKFVPGMYFDLVDYFILWRKINKA